MSTVNPRKCPLGGVVTSLVAIPNRTWNPVTRHHLLAISPQTVGAHLAGESSSRRMFSSFVLTDQGFCFRKPWRERFSDLSGGPVNNLDASVLTRRARKVTPGNLELATPGLAATGSPPWAAPAALISMCGKVGLEGRFSLWAGASWWARGDLGVLSQSHLRMGCQ